MLHEEYFHNISGDGGGRPGDRTMKLLNEGFGSYDGFTRDFKATCNSARGWCLTAYDQRSGKLRNILCDSHDDGLVLAAYPVIVMDMYEHAYFYDYLTDKAAYIEAFLRGINWDAVEKRACKI